MLSNYFCLFIYFNNYLYYSLCIVHFVYIGDVVSIRFKASYKGKDFDNTFENPQPYMFRAG